MVKKKSMMLLMFTTLCVALITGLFYAYSCSVNPGLSKLTDAQYLAAMQSINMAIINPLFMITFIGALLLLPWCAYQNFSLPTTSRCIFVFAATLFYAVGVFGVTVTGNVPLNNFLEKIDLSTASVEAIHDYRLRFEKPWNRFHTIRTMFSILTLVCVVAACLFDNIKLRDVLSFKS
jgi:uncharacterized membrane protein